MEIKRVIVLLIIVIVLSSSLTYVLYQVIYKKVKIAEFGMDLIVTERKSAYGVNIDIDAIHLGMLPRGAGSLRRLNLTNSEDYNVIIYFIKDNSTLSSIVSISPNYFVLKPDEKILVNFAVHVPQEFEPGNYTGKVDVMKKVLFFRK